MISVVASRSDQEQSFTSHVLLLSDNQETQCNFTSVGQILINDLENLFFLDKLPVPEIINLSIHQSIAHEFSFDNLLYADLKLVRLIDEYEGLKKRSEAVLEGLDVPFLQRKNEFEMPLYRKEPNIAETADRLFSNSHLADSSEMPRLHRRNRTNPYLASKSRPAIGGRNFVNRPTVLNSGPVYTLPKKAELPNSNIGTEHGQETHVGAESQLIQYGAHGNTNWPWIVRIPLRLFNYFIQHKIEAIIYFLMICGLIHIVFKSKK